MERLIAFFKDEDGLELSEYAVMGGLIIVGLTAAVTALGDQIDLTLTAITAAMIPAP